VLLVACANVASLLFARAAARHREVGVRVALGAGRARLVRQLITESVVLAVTGGGVGLALSFWTTGFIEWFLPAIPYRFAIDTRPDLTVFGFAVAVSALAAFAFGLLPAIHATSPNLASVLKGESAGAGTAVHKARMLNGVVVAMVALSFVTLLLSGLFTKSLDGVRDMNPGFASTQRLLATFNTGLGGFEPREGMAFLDELEERTRALPGVRSAAWVTNVPLGDRSGSSRVYADDRTYQDDDLGVQAWRSTVSPGYFETIGTRVLQGRDFSDQDDPDAPLKVIVNQTLARLYWPDANAVGQRLRFSRTAGGTTLEIVGTVEDGRYISFGETPRPAMFLALAQVPESHVNLVVHADMDPLSLIAPVRREAAAINPAVPMFDVKSMDDHLTFALWMYRLGAGLGAVLGLLALVLASAGLYGVMAFSVGQRTRELGIRVALGAPRGRVLFLVLQRGLALAGLGIGIGAVAALGLSGVLHSVLLGVTPTDPGTFTAVAAGLAAVALLASVMPARNATRADPVEALRAE
jgi:predicted permease